MTSNNHNAYRADIDGLRAIAVIAVILYHYAIPGFAGGYVGVDIFFVISGYLISGMLFRNIKDGKFSFSDFYERRIRRLYPSMVFVLLTTIVLFYFFKSVLSLEHFSKSLLYLSVFSSNFLFSQETSYFDIGANSKLLLHTWSLAIEEQFYLVWPGLLILIQRLKIQTKAMTLLLIFLSLGLSIYLTNVNQPLAFYLLPSRAFELLIGGYAALMTSIVVTKKEQKIILSLVTLGCLFFPIFFYGHETAFPGYTALLPCVGAFLLIISSNKSNYVNSFLSNKLFVFVGLISYPLYLWHWPLYVFYLQVADVAFEYLKIADYGQGKALLFILTVLLSYISYKFFEQPVRAKLVFKTRSSVFWVFAIFTLFIIAFSYFSLKGKGPLSGEASAAYSVEATYADTQGLRQPIKPVDLNFPKSLDGYLSVIGKKDDKPGYVLWGDSQAEQLLPIFAKFYTEKKISGLFVYSRVPAAGVLRKTHEFLTFQESRELVDSLEKYIRVNKVSNFIIASHWNFLISGPSKGASKKFGIPVNETSIIIEDKKILAETYFEEQFIWTINKLKRTGVKIWVIAPIPELNIQPHSFLNSLKNFGFDEAAYYHSFADYQQRSAKIHNLFQQVSAAINVINPADYLCFQDKCPLIKDGHLLYHDESHITTYGALLMSEAVSSALTPKIK